MPDYPGQTPQDMVSLAVQHLRNAYPDIEQASVSPAGPISRSFMSGGSQGFTSPFGGIYLNTTGLSQDQTDQLLAHEMMHRQQFARQGALKGLWGLMNKDPAAADPTKQEYWQNPDETGPQGGYQAQRQWEWANRDRPLPPRGQ